jgi:branched-chain amino acid transport system substrate-binding protein
MKNFIYLLFLIFSTIVFAGDEYNLYIDADFSVHKNSANSIKRGVQASIDYYNSKNTPLKINVITLNHRGNTRRSLANLKKMQKDPKFLAVIGGMHSPPLITNNKYINNNKILTLVPWAAGGPITRSKQKENWIYRLSVDDAQAGGFIAKMAISKAKCSSPFLILENTPWGKSNEKNMKNGLKEHKLSPNNVQMFGWGISKSSSSEIADKVSKSNADCIFFVGNSTDSITIFNSLGSKKSKLPIFSHWGITGGSNRKMAEVINSNKLDVRIVQTKFSFLNLKLNEYQKNVLNFIQKKYNLLDVREIRPMTGWVHSFDLTTILLKSLGSIAGKINNKNVEDALKAELENLHSPVIGLIKTYRKPFTKYNLDTPNAHEALGRGDYILRKYDLEGNLR